MKLYLKWLSAGCVFIGNNCKSRNLWHSLFNIFKLTLKLAPGPKKFLSPMRQLLKSHPSLSHRPSYLQVRVFIKQVNYLSRNKLRDFVYWLNMFHETSFVSHPPLSHWPSYLQVRVFHQTGLLSCVKQVLGHTRPYFVRLPQNNGRLCTATLTKLLFLKTNSNLNPI
jgi:hypothetical protein